MSTLCDQARDWLAERDPLQAPRHLAHLATCAACQRATDRYDQLTAALDALGGDEVTDQAEAAFLDRVRVAMQPEVEVLPLARPRRRWPLAVALLAAATVLFALFVRAPAPAPAPTPDPRPVAAVPATPEIWSAVATAVQTGPAAQTLRGPDGIEVQVRPDSELNVAAWGADEVVLQLSEGSVDISLDRHERFVVETPNSRVVVVGTVFTVDWDAQTGTRVVVREGIVRVETLDGTLLREVAAGDLLQVPVTPIDTGETTAEAFQPSPSRLPEEPLAAALPEAEPPADDGSEAAAPTPTPTPTRLDEARRHLLDGDLDDALRLLESNPPTDWTEAMLLGDALTLDARLEKAEAAYQTALSLGAPGPVARVELARLQQGPLGAPQRAADTWRTYLEHRPTGRHAHEARLAIAHTQPPDTQVVLAPVLAEPDSAAWPEAYTLMAAYLVREQAWQDLQVLLEPHRDAEGATGEVALVGLLRVALARGERAQARALVAQYRSSFPAGARLAEVDHLASAVYREKSRSSGTQLP